MKKLNKVLLLIVSLFGITLMNVNATTYTNDKRVNFKEIEEPVDAWGFLNYEGKSYFYRDTPELMELVYGDKLSLKMSDYNLSILDEMYPNQEISQFYWGGEGGLTEEKYTIGFKYIDSKEIDLEDIPNGGIGTSGEVWLDGYHNNNIYMTVDVSTYDDETEIYERTDMYLAIYDDKEFKLEKTLKFSELVKEYISEETELWDFYLSAYGSIDSKTTIIVAEYRIWDEETNDLLSYALIFNENGELLSEIKNEEYFESIIPVYQDGKLKIAYVTYEEEYEKSALKVTDGENVKTILKSDKYFFAYNSSGLIVVSGDKNIIYDSNFNVIKEYNDVDNIEVYKERSSLEEVSGIILQDTPFSKEVQNGNYLVNLIVKEVNEEDYTYSKVIKSELMTIEDSKKANISGYIKDKNGNPLKDHIVELHSTPRTYTTDKDGYFKFDNVEEGKHTLTVKDPEGKVLVTREINVIEGTETKLDNNTLYFNPSDNGFNLNIKIDGDKLVVDSVDKGVKEPNKNIIEKLEDVVVPKTFDGIIMYILVFSTLIGTAIYLTRKNRRIKYTNIK